MERTEIGTDLKVGYATHAGMTGKRNEDFFGLFAWKLDGRRKFYLGVVADGVGGQTAGEVASHLTVDTIQKYFDEQDSIDNVNRHLEQAILSANQVVYRESQKNPAYQGMSTTVAMVAMLDGRLYSAHVGDSRIYLLRDGRLQQLSVDHTWAQEAIEAGLLTPEQAKTHPNRNVIRRHLGGSSKVEVDHRLVLQAGQSVKGTEGNQGTALLKGDTLLVCSDGLSDMISDGAIHESLLNHFQDLPVAANELVNKANQAGGKDNITIVLMQMPTKVAPVAVVVPPPGVAATTVAAASTQAAAPAQAAAKSGVGRTTWLIVGGAVLLVLVIVVAGVLLVVGSSFRDRDQTTPEATAMPVESIDTTLPAGAPATAAILATAQSATGTVDGASAINTPGLIPTLRSTTTPTAVRRATLAPTSTSPAVATNTPTSGQSNGSSSGSSKPKPPTAEPPTSEPPTSAPPTAEPPTAEPPTAEPPTAEPPTEEPPTEEPPTKEPPTSEPVTEEPPTLES